VYISAHAMAPTDSDNVQAALRLGWLFAEVRGRARPGGPTSAEGRAFARGAWALPLGSERSAAEREVERQHALQAVAEGLHVDDAVPEELLKYLAPDPAVPAAGALPPPAQPAAPPAAAVPDPAAAPVPPAAPAAAPAPPAAASPPPTYSDEMRRLGTLLSSQKKTKDPETLATWLNFAHLLYKWDAHIQDTLLSASEVQANAYELGRALAETYWALDPRAVQTISKDGVVLPNPVSWSFLLGKERRAVISRLLGRLVAYFHPLTAPAVDGSVAVWGEVAANEEWRGEKDAVAKLRQQTSNWYSLVVAGLDPETLLKPYALLRSWRIFGKTFRVFGLEMVVGVISTAAIALVGLLAAYTDANKHLQTIVAALGVLGITGSALQARLKNTTQSTIARLQLDLSTDLVADQITDTPNAPMGARGPSRRRKAIAGRTVTAPLPPPRA